MCVCVNEKRECDIKRHRIKQGLIMTKFSREREREEKLESLRMNEKKNQTCNCFKNDYLTFY